MAEVRWAPQAADDLEATCLFIARDSPQIAATFADRILRATALLGSSPRMGRIVPEMGSDSMREIIVGSYRVIYRIRLEEVQVLTVHQGARFLDAAKIEGT